LNDALAQRGYGRPISEQGPDPFQRYRDYPPEWMRAMTEAVVGHPDARLRDVVLELRRRERSNR
jgi:hypothetical protein